ncbi:MAG: HD domain-containing phosphohydrolase, partial [Oceanospirillum sp.]|nr:HD domain-containing phosphohydrolase [Oceanospirillum sp.]
VGKIGIPDGVLMKPGKLSPQEFRIMQSHARIGYEILSDAKTPLMKLAAEVAHSHHERWDGTGYPKGLKGEEIPLESRIVALCDVYDALRSARPYKTPWSRDGATQYIREESGKHFDPDISSAFLSLIDKIEAVRDSYPDPEIEKTIEDFMF